MLENERGLAARLEALDGVHSVRWAPREHLIRDMYNMWRKGKEIL